MNIPENILKATLFATSIFWLILMALKGFDINRSTFVVISLIPISICCAITICITIVPFFSFKKKGKNNRTIFNTYFPYYAIVSFSLCLYGSIKVPDLICFFAAAFFTTLQSWVWFGKERDHNVNNEYQNLAK